MTVREIDPRDPGAAEQSSAASPSDASQSDAIARCVGVAPPTSFLQTPFWAGFKGEHGWHERHFIIDESFFLTVLVRPLSRFMSIAYVPLPFDAKPCDGERGEYLSRLSSSLKPYLPHSTIFVRYDPPWSTVITNEHCGSDGQGDERIEGQGGVDSFPEPPGKPAVRAASNTQPPDTVVLDLTRSEDALLAQMKPKWRYNVKLAEKKGVAIRYLAGDSGASAGVDVFYALYLETAKRDGIAVHSKAYYSSLVRRAAGYEPTAFDKPVSVRVYVAEYEGIALASIITLFCGDEAVYLYGASSNEKRNLMPAYALQWRAIRDAAQYGCERYDFFGIPPTDDPSHPMYGLYRFKTGFGGSIVHRVGSWDIPLNEPAYRAYRVAEKLRDFWFKKAVKRLRGIRRSS